MKQFKHQPIVYGWGVKTLTISLLTTIFSFTTWGQTPPNNQNILNATGNVGVGTLSPDSKLQVNGSVRIDSSLTVSDSAVFEKRTHIKDRIVVDEDAIIKGKLIAKDKLKVNGTAKFNGKVKMTALPNAGNADTALLFINGNGKVKKGTLAHLLEVIGQNPSSAIPLLDVMYPGPETYLPCIDPTHHEPVWRNGVGKMWTGIGCPAKVGIGRTPSYDLDVLGTTRTRDLIVSNNNANIFYSKKIGNIKFMMLDGAYSSLAFKAPGNNAAINGNWAIEYNTSAGGLNFWKPWPNANGFGNYFLFLKDNGNVGIGTKDAKYKLSVEGTIGAREVIVTPDSWADFVFEKDYTLPTLSETETYIQANGHLPNVPSAKEVAKNGLNLGEMNKILLQKVEELTLYLIQQNEVFQSNQLILTKVQGQIDAQQALIKEQQQLIEALQLQVRNYTKH